MTKKAKAAAMAAALATVRAAPAKVAKPVKLAKVAKIKFVSDSDKALAAQVKELRDGGMPWWQIGHELELPGHADNVQQGKGGASRARQLYVKGYGSLPATARSLAKQTGGTFGNGVKPKGKANHERILKDPAMETMFNDDVSEDDLRLMLQGRKITWSSNLSDSQEQAYVHPKIGFSLIDCPSGRAITFREETRDAGAYNGTPGQTRTVRLTNIVRVAR